MARLCVLGAHMARLRDATARARPGSADAVHELRPWASFEAQRAWKESDEFRERIMRVLRHTEDFTPSTFELVTQVD
jgi:heme-degrading monooxygenase HmoA